MLIEDLFTSDFLVQIFYHRFFRKNMMDMIFFFGGGAREFIALRVRGFWVTGWRVTGWGGYGL